MARHTRARTVFLYCCAVSFLLGMAGGIARAQPVAHAGARTAKEPIRIAVVPFRNSMGQTGGATDTAAVLGQGIADSLTNALKSVAGLAVTDSDVVLKAAANLPDAHIEAKDADAAAVAESLAARIVVAGGYQLLPGGLIHVDARILQVGKAAPPPAQTIVADASYPSGYSELLRKLASAVIAKLKVPISELEAESVQDILDGIRSPEAYQWYARGEQQKAQGTRESLKRAIEYFDEALKRDRGYALALAAKSEAEAQLFKLGGDSDDTMGRAALAHAQAAVGASPRLGRGYAAQAAAYAALGDQDAATNASRLAHDVWPSDARSLLELAKALGNGRLVRSAETDRAFSLQPGLALLFPEMPKVVVENHTNYSLTLKFTADEGGAYPAAVLRPNSSRIFPLFAGSYRVSIEGEIGRIDDHHTFEEGKDYKLDLSGGSLPFASFTFVNGGGAYLSIDLSGPTRRALRLRPGETKESEVLSGKYRATARIPGASRTDDYDLDKGQSEQVEYRYSGAIFDPAKIVVTNSGNASFMLTAKGKKSYAFSIPPGGRTFTVTAGSYEIQASCGGESSGTDTYEFSAGSETTIDEFGCSVVYR